MKLHVHIDGYNNGEVLKATSWKPGYEYVDEKDGIPGSGIILISLLFLLTLFTIGI
jgi:hypothetical protein